MASRKPHPSTPGLPPSRGQSESGHLLPLSIVSSLLLLTSSVALQMADKHALQIEAQAEARKVEDDLLISAAHLIGHELQPSTGFHQCLSRIPRTSWATCADGTRGPTTLLQAVNNTLKAGAFGAVEISEWTPTYEGTSLTGLLTVRSISQGLTKQQKSFRLRFLNNGQFSSLSEPN